MAGLMLSDDILTTYIRVLNRSFKAEILNEHDDCDYHESIIHKHFTINGQHGPKHIIYVSVSMGRFQFTDIFDLTQPKSIRKSALILVKKLKEYFANQALNS